MEENKNNLDNSQSDSWGGSPESTNSWGGNSSDSQSNGWGGAQPNNMDSSNGSWNGQEQSNSWNTSSGNMNAWDGSSNGGWDQSSMGWNGDSSMNGNGYSEFDSTQMGYGQNGYGYDNNTQANFGYDNTQGAFGNFGYDNTQATYGNQNEFGYDNTQGFGNFGYGNDQNGYGQDMYGYPQNNSYGNNMGDVNSMNGSEKKDKKSKKKFIIIGAIAAVVIAAIVVVCILVFGGKKLPKDLSDFQYTEDVTYEEFLDAYYNGNEKSFLRSASSPDFNELINHSSKYVNDTFVINGYVTSVEGSLYYLSETEGSFEEYCCFNGGDLKKVSVGDYIEVYGIFTQLSENKAYPCMVIWKYEQKDAPVAVTPTEVTPGTDVTIPDVQLSDEEQAFIDNLKVSYIDSEDHKVMYYYIENGNKDSNYTSARLNVYFYNESDECIAFNSDSVYFATNQPYCFGYIPCYDDNSSGIEFAKAVYYFDDVYTFSTEREQYFDDVDIEVTNIDDSAYKVTGTITNNTDKNLDVSGFLVFYNDKKEIIEYTYIFQYDLEPGETAFDDYCFVDMDKVDVYDIYWDSVTASY